MEIATLGGGCFWCLEAVYQQMEGVDSIVSGYMGGHVDRPTYKQVCTGATGHVEVVQVTFDPAVTSYREILEVFFATHDPTSFDRQGNDAGPQYRSVIFYTSEEQHREAEAVISELNAAHEWPDPIVTALEPAGKFFVAEDYHQEYYANHRFQPYCQFVVAPKVKKFQQKFSEKMKA